MHHFYNNKKLKRPSLKERWRFLQYVFTDRLSLNQTTLHQLILECGQKLKKTDQKKLLILAAKKPAILITVEMQAWQNKHRECMQRRLKINHQMKKFWGNSSSDSLSNFHLCMP